MRAALPANERDRLGDLEDYRVLDTDADESFDRIVRLARAAANTPIGVISLIDGERQWFKARQGLDNDETPREQAFCAHAILNDDVLVVEDATKDARFADNPLVTGADGIPFYAGAPMKSPRGHNLGTVCVIDRVPRKIDLGTLALLRDMAALAVSQLELRRLAGVDALTGSFNRQFMDEMARREFRRAVRASQPVSVAVIDADHFKSVNDTFGHGAGDSVLRGLAKTCEGAVRSPDVFGRYGGEEFLLIMPDTTLTQAGSVLERLREAVSCLDVPDLKGQRNVTVSVGAAQLNRNDRNLASVIARADEALYRAKQSGRNRVAYDTQN